MLGQKPVSAIGGLEGESEIRKLPCHLHHTRLVLLGYGDQDSSLGWEHLLGCLLGLKKRETKRTRHTQYFTCGPHLRTQEGVNLREHIKRKYRLFYPKVGNRSGPDIKFAQFFAQHGLGGKPCHGDVAHL